MTECCDVAGRTKLSSMPTGGGAAPAAAAATEAAAAPAGKAEAAKRKWAKGCRGEIEYNKFCAYSDFHIVSPGILW